MGSPAFQNVARASEIEVGKSRCVEIAGREILICRTVEGFFAVENVCSHARSKLEGGRLRGHRLHCPLHGAAFDVRDGRALSRPALQPIRCFAVQVDEDDVWVDPNAAPAV